MKFFMGLVTGMALGAAGAVWYSVQSGRDLRESFEAVRDELQRRDYEAIQQRLETGFAQLQSQIETRMASARDDGTAADEAREMVGDVKDAAADAAESAGDAVDEAAKG
jgi:gas vesicle protein